jgi:hypothetical protein
MKFAFFIIMIIAAFYSPMVVAALGIIAILYIADCRL